MAKGLQTGTIHVGSTNSAKVNAVKGVLPRANVTGLIVDSFVSAQPSSDEETQKGAVARAREVVRKSGKQTYGIGLEGGIMKLGTQVFLCNWGALFTADEQLFVASGARIPLPSDIVRHLDEGLELGEVMEAYVKRSDVRKREGAIGIFTNERISRTSMFTHVIELLVGQYEFAQK